MVQMKKTTIALTLLLCSLMLLIPFHAALSKPPTTTQSTPLFDARINQVTAQYHTNPSYTYLGQEDPYTIQITSRNLITTHHITQLQETTPQLPNASPLSQQKWTLLLKHSHSLLHHLNSVYRENSQEIKTFIDHYTTLDATQQLTELNQMLSDLSLTDLQELTNTQVLEQPAQNTNITSGAICNITSGAICQITTQPICGLTLQPLCALITMTPPCITLMGFRCPTAGFKCNPPTTGTICQIWTKLGPVVKSLFLVLIAAVILFLPAVLLVTILAPQFCSNIQERITTRFNCTETLS